MGCVNARDSVQQDEAVQSLLEEVYLDSVCGKEIADLIEVRSKKHQPRYGYSMEVKRLWKVRDTEEIQHLEQLAGKRYGAPMQLFHGTRPNHAQNIIDYGFRLPRRPGMFGRGVYFAKDPLKSVNFAREGKPVLGRSESFWSWLWGSTEIDEPDPVRRMLLCDVWLGRTRTLRKARPDLNPEKHLRRNRLMRCLGAKEFNSIRAPGGTFGAVGVTEYVVYNEEQAIPRYLIEFEQKPLLRGHRRPPGSRARSAPPALQANLPAGGRSRSAPPVLSKAPPTAALQQQQQPCEAGSQQALSPEASAIAAAAMPEPCVPVVAASPLQTETLPPDEQLAGPTAAATPHAAM
mmetsp:Transcript_72531/g.132850  ORF Transcript_72531/g.132850 Transcript_72531/m.132850 type:complete len:347 (-) Transcript_72531:81-1121(-)